MIEYDWIGLIYSAYKVKNKDLLILFKAERVEWFCIVDTRSFKYIRGYVR